jgi:hypothetical protein
MSGGYVARKFPMWTGSWLAYGETLRNSAIGAAPFLHKATMRPHVQRIATTGKGVMIGVTIEVMGRGVTTETTVQGVTAGNTGQGLMTMTTNKPSPPLGLFGRLAHLVMLPLVPRARSCVRPRRDCFCTLASLAVCSTATIGTAFMLCRSPQGR